MSALPAHWPGSAEAADLWSRVRAAPRSLLMLDYDGTLAPFREQRLEAYPYPGVAERLATLSRLEKVRLVIVSGRAAREVEDMLSSLPGTQKRIEIWGDHGQERLRADGAYSLRPAGDSERKFMEMARREIARLGFAEAMEIKPASLAVHWRRLGAEERSRIRTLVEEIYRRHGGESGMRLLDFDGGVELRPKTGGKDGAVEQILAEEASGPPAAQLPAAYLGDDVTDEDAFRAAGERALSILVRVQPRESSARFWLKPPAELLHFLDCWIQAAEGTRP